MSDVVTYAYFLIGASLPQVEVDLVARLQGKVHQADMESTVFPPKKNVGERNLFQGLRYLLAIPSKEDWDHAGLQPFSHSLKLHPTTNSVPCLTPAKEISFNYSSHSCIFKPRLPGTKGLAPGPAFVKFSIPCMVAHTFSSPAW